jgi:hypothetical protein
MNKKTAAVLATVGAAALLAACTSAPMAPATGPMSFFVTSVGSGKGADLGGLAGADAHCQRLATAAGAGGKTWRAYLSTQGAVVQGGPWTAGANARDRIGKGPWFNAKGVLVARDVEHLHNGNNINKQTALDERGNLVNGRTERPNEHDILTGSRADGTTFSPAQDMTCKNWTSSTDGAAMVGHHDVAGPTGENWAKSWNFSHPTSGCGQQALASTGGSGRFYCFAAN